MHWRYSLLMAGVLAMSVTELAAAPPHSERQAAPPKADAARLKADVKRLSVDFYPRSYDQIDNLDRTAQFIRGEFAKTGGAVSEQPLSVRGKTYRNIVLRFGPAQGPLLVIGAHYDSHGDVLLAQHRGAVSPSSHTPGADDNASGTAGLLELARLLGRNPPSRPVELVAYTLEEPPFFRTADMGSAWHARRLKSDGREVDLMVSLEMIGYFDDKPGSQQYPMPGMAAQFSERGDFILVAGRHDDGGLAQGAKTVMAAANDLPVHAINAPPLLQGIDFSDHLNYWHEGFPALMVTDTAFLRNPNYHKAGDTFDTLDYARMAKVVQAVYALTRQPSPPAQ